MNRTRRYSIFSGVQPAPGLGLACRIVLMLLVALQALAAATSSPGKLLLLSDIHFNPMADPALVSGLERADPSQWEAILRQSKLTAFSTYGQDTNWWLLQDALRQMQTSLPRPALVIYTGDMLAHEFRAKFVKTTGDTDWQHYRAFVLKTVEFEAMELQQHFAGTPILLTPGNNDDDCGDYTIQSNGAFLHDTAAMVRDLARADDSIVPDWQSLGSYSVLHPTIAHLRILSLNTVFLSNEYQPEDFSAGCSAIQSHAATDLLAWLQHQLEQAQRQQERVWLSFHIPPGIDGYATTHHDESPPTPAAVSCPNTIVPMWAPGWTAQFDALLEQYHDTVIASFAGHTHMDDFRLVGSQGNESEFVLINPAISPIFQQNPAFRVVDFARDGRVIGESTYYLTNLKRAGKMKHGRWKREYRFAREWKLKFDLASLAKIDSEIPGDKKVRQQWERFYVVSSTAEPPFPANVVRGLYCAIGSLDVASYSSCYCSAQATGTSTPGW